MKLFKWIYPPSGYCPVQAEGYFLNNYFYFRSRWDTARIEFSRTQKDWEDYKLIKSYNLLTIKSPISGRYLIRKLNAGWLNHNYAKWLIYKGCLKFLLKFKS